MSDNTALFIAAIVMLLVGGGFAYGGLALIRNLHGLRDRMLDENAGRGGWRRSSYDDPSHPSEGVGFSVSFDYVSKSPFGWKMLGWTFLLGGLFWAAVAVIMVVAALLG